jgi:hypothetical protein
VFKHLNDAKVVRRLEKEDAHMDGEKKDKICTPPTAPRGPRLKRRRETRDDGGWPRSDNVSRWAY